MRRVLGAIAIALALAAAGCGGGGRRLEAARVDDHPRPADADTAACEPGRPGGRLVLAEISDPKTFNALIENEQSSREITSRMVEGLTDLDPITQKVRPGLARSWETADGRTWTFHLRRGVRWSDGAPFTAADVLFSFEVLYDKAIHPAMSDLLTVGGKPFAVKKLDDYTVEITTPTPFAPFENFIGGVRMMPRHKLEEAYRSGSFEAAYGVSTPPADLVYTGPFRLKEYKPGEKCVLERNPYYWRFDSQGQRLPYLDQLIFVTVPDHNARILQFESGDTDLIDDIPADGYERIAAGAAKGGYTVYDLGPGFALEFLWFNCRTDRNPEGAYYVPPYKQRWFNNVNFRRALSHAIDGQSIIETILYGRGTEHWGTTATVANKRWHNPDVVKHPYDLAEAARLLEGEGFADRDGDGVREDPEGHPLELVVLTNSENNRRGQIGNLVREDWARIGVKATFSGIAFNDLVRRGKETHAYEAMLLGLAGGGLDPGSGMNVWKSSGTTHYWWPEQAKPATAWEARVDSLMDAQMQELDHAKRKALYDQVQRIVSDMCPILMCPVRHISVAGRNTIGNLKPVVLEHRLLWNADELYLKSPEEMAAR